MAKQAPRTESIREVHGCVTRPSHARAILVRDAVPLEVTMLVVSPLSMLSALQALMLQTMPHGGQRGARRNAWASMSADASMARARREAASALDAATRRDEDQVRTAR